MPRRFFYCPNALTSDFGPWTLDFAPRSVPDPTRESVFTRVAFGTAPGHYHGGNRTGILNLMYQAFAMTFLRRVREHFFGRWAMVVTADSLITRELKKCISNSPIQSFVLAETMYRKPTAKGRSTIS